jgi:outer membrane protein assembly factor BamB
MNKVVGVAAVDGQILWTTPFTAKMAACASPLSIRDGRIFITSGCDAGSMMVKVQKGASGFTLQKLYDLTSAQFHSEVHTPILYKNFLYAVSSKSKGRFSCVNLDGKVVWQSPVDSSIPAATRTFGLGGFLLAEPISLLSQGNNSKHESESRGKGKFTWKLK